MKRIFTQSFILILVIFMSTKSMAQENTSKDEDRPLEMKVDSIEKKPDFPGGINKFYRFVGKNFKVPEKALKYGGKVKLQFIIEKDGTLSDIKAVEDIGYGTGEEAVRVIKLSPKWLPGSNNGLPVRVLYKLPITLTPAI